MNWYQVKVRLERIQDAGNKKKVSEQYLVQALTFGEAERLVQEEIAQSASGEVDVVAVARKNYAEIIASKLSDEISDRWYKCKVNFITLNEKNGKEEKTSRYLKSSRLHRKMKSDNNPTLALFQGQGGHQTECNDERYILFSTRL